MGAQGVSASAVVVGAGVAGLAAARRLLGDGYRVTVLEAGQRPGGMIAPLDIAGRQIDAGAEAYARRTGVADQLCDELGLEVAAPAGRPLIRWADGRSWPGADGVLGVPASADDPALAGALDEQELAAARAEPELGDEVGAEATSLGELVEARLGQAVVERLVAPLTRSVYRMEPGQMPLQRFAPGLAGPGSLYAKVAAARGSRPVLAQPVGGMFRLVQALADDIGQRGGQLRLGVRAERLERVNWDDGAYGVGGGAGAGEASGDRARAAAAGDRARAAAAGDGVGAAGARAGDTASAAWAASSRDARVGADGAGTDLGDAARPSWRLLAGGEAILADRVVLACPARPAIDLLSQAGVYLSEAGVDQTQATATGASASAILALDADELADLPACSGVLLGQAIPSLAARSLTRYSSKWPWSRGRAEFVRLSYEPGVEPTKEQALADAGILLGCRLRRALDFATVRWQEIPRGLSAEARAALKNSLPPGLTVAGAWMAGNGVEAAIASGLEAAA